MHEEYQQKEQARHGLGRRENETSLPAIVTGQEMSHPHFHAYIQGTFRHFSRPFGAPTPYIFLHVRVESRAYLPLEPSRHIMYEYVLVLLRHVSRSPISLEHLDLATVEEGLSIGSERDSGYVTRSFALPHCRDQLAQTQQIPVLTVLSSRTGNSLGSVLQSEEREEREKRRKRHHAGPTGHVAVLRVLLLHGDIVHGACVLMSCSWFRGIFRSDDRAPDPSCGSRDREMHTLLLHAVQWHGNTCLNGAEHEMCR